MNSLKHMENHLRGIAKRYKRIQFSTALAVVFLMLGVKAFAEMGSGIEADSQLEVMQLLKQEDQVTKSPREFSHEVKILLNDIFIPLVIFISH